MRPAKKIQERILSIAPDIFDQTPVLFAYLFGSYATGLVNPFSDLDIGIYIENDHHKGTLSMEMSLAIEIDEKLAFGISTDVRVINNLPLIIAGKIVTEGLIIYSKDEVARVDFETTIRPKYFDFLPIIREYYMTYMESVTSKSKAQGS